MEASRRRRHGLAVCAFLVACKGGHHAPPVGEQVGKALEAVVAAADHVRAPWRCAAADTAVFAAEKVTVAGRVWELAEHALRGSFDDDETTIAVIGDAGGAAPRTIAALGKLREKLDSAHVDLAIVLGGMGTTQPELEATLGTIADKAEFPVVALAGDLEGETAQRAAIEALRKRGDLVVDARLARFIELPGVSIGTVPGASAAARLVAGADGCGWTPGDVAALYTALAAKGSLRVAALAEAPRQSSVPTGEVAGELALVPGAAQQVDVLLHGAAPATPAREGDRDGAAAALAPGSCDATTRLDTSGPPTAGLLVIRGARWRWRLVTID